jgi:hypothetical protein
VRIKTTSFVPPGVSARVLIIETENLPAHAEVEYFTELVLGESWDQSPLNRTSYADGMISAQNPSNMDFPCDTFYLVDTVREHAFTCNSLTWRSGRYDNETGAGMLPCAAARYPADQPLVIVTGCDDPEKLKALASIDSARQALRETIGFWQDVTGHLRVRTPDEDLNIYLKRLGRLSDNGMPPVWPYVPVSERRCFWLPRPVAGCLCSDCTPAGGNSSAVGPFSGAPV